VNCRQFEHFLDQYLDGELKGSMKLEFEAHLVDCKTCGHLYATMDVVGAIISVPTPDEPRLSSGFADRVLARMKEQKVRPVKSDININCKLKFPMWRQLSAAASVALVIAGTWVYTRSHTATGPGAAGSLLASRADEKNSQGINLWLAGTLEQAGSSLWELKELQSTAVNQVKQGLFKSLAGPAPISETVEISKQQAVGDNSADSPPPRDTRTAGLELL
jgi:hypothetical protein